jgi:YfiH family protein
MLLAPEWEVPPRVRAVMTTRRGGVSLAPWDSLNLGIHVGDSSAAVFENRRRVSEEARLPAEPVWLEQVHGTSVVVLDGSPASTAGALASVTSRDKVRAPAEVASLSARPRGDSAVTAASGVVCAIQVADCMPVLFAARDGSAVGAAHAGWRGLAGGVLEATVSAMKMPANQLVAWLGPAIGPKHFEVGDDVVEAFTSKAPLELRAQTRAAFVSNPPSEVRPAGAGRPTGKWLCDLYALARLRLAAMGVTQVSGGGLCTVTDADRFYSYRRDGQTGRMAALIWLEPGSLPSRA